MKIITCTVDALEAQQEAQRQLDLIMLRHNPPARYAVQLGYVPGQLYRPSEIINHLVGSFGRIVPGDFHFPPHQLKEQTNA